MCSIMDRETLLLGYAHLRYALGLPPELCKSIYDNLKCECKIRSYKTKKYPTYSVCKSANHLCLCLKLAWAGIDVGKCKGKGKHDCTCIQYTKKRGTFHPNNCRAEKEDHPCICSKGACLANAHYCVCSIYHTDKIKYISPRDEDIPVYYGTEPHITSCTVPYDSHKCTCSIKFNNHEVSSITTSLCRCIQNHNCICKSYYDNTITIVPEDQRTKVRKCKALTHIFA